MRRLKFIGQAISEGEEKQQKKLVEMGRTELKNCGIIWNVIINGNHIQPRMEGKTNPLGVVEEITAITEAVIVIALIFRAELKLIKLRQETDKVDEEVCDERAAKSEKRNIANAAGKEFLADINGIGESIEDVSKIYNTNGQYKKVYDWYKDSKGKDFVSKKV